MPPSRSSRPSFVLLALALGCGGRGVVDRLPSETEVRSLDPSALEARFASVQRMLNVVADADEQLRVLDARLLAAVARGAELAVTADTAALASVGSDLEGVVAELGVLRGALTSLG